MNLYQIQSILDNQVKMGIQNYQMRGMITPQQYQFVLGEWAKAQQTVASRVPYTYPNGDINDQQASAIANNFINKALQNFNIVCNQPNMMNNGMMYQNPNMMMGGNGMMYGNQYQGMNPGAMFQPMGTNYGGMYGGAPAPAASFTPSPQNPGNPYGATMNIPPKQTTQDYCASVLGEAAKPMPQTTAPQQKVEEKKVVQQAQPMPWSFKMHVDEQVKEIDGVVKETRKLMDATDEKTPVAVTTIETDEDFTDDFSAIRNVTHGLDFYNGPQFTKIFFNRIGVYHCPKKLLENFQKYLKENTDRDLTKDSRDNVNFIVESIKKHFETMIGKDSAALTKIVLAGVNYRGICGELTGVGKDQYSLTFSNLDELVKADNIDRVATCLVNTIHDIMNYEILDLMESGVRKLTEKIIPRSFCLNDLDDITDPKVIEDTVNEVHNVLCVVRRRRVVYHLTKLAVPGIIEGSKFDYIKSPTFFGTPDNSFEHLATEAFTNDHPKYGPVRLYLQATPNQMLGYIVGLTTDNRMRLAPWTI